MFEINKDEMMKEKIENEARKMFGKMLSQSILESDKAPEYMKLSVRIMDKSEDVQEAVHELVEHYIKPHEGHQANAETLKKILEYLELVETGIKQFVETTPFVAHTEEE